MSFMAYPGEQPTVTGAAILSNLQWEKVPANDHSTNCTVYNNTDVSGGNDLQPGVETDTAEECETLCRKNCACSIAVWGKVNPTTHNCYLKHSPAHITKTVVGNTAIVCSASCSPPSPRSASLPIPSLSPPFPSSSFFFSFFFFFFFLLLFFFPPGLFG